jgi:hypothetical protein
VVDIDLFAEALVQLIMREDHAGLDHVITSMCARADIEPLISLTRFMSMMGVLCLSISMTVFYLLSSFSCESGPLCQSIRQSFCACTCTQKYIRNLPVSKFRL